MSGQYNGAESDFAVHGVVGVNSFLDSIERPNIARLIQAAESREQEQLAG